MYVIEVKDKREEMADSAKRSSELEIEETVIDILKKANMEETTEYKVRKMASEKLGLDLNSPELKQFVRRVVESYLDSLNSQTNQQDEDEEAAEEAEDEDQNQRKRGGQEYDDEGDLIICRVSSSILTLFLFYLFVRHLLK